jgi:hypothetical protein
MEKSGFVQSDQRDPAACTQGAGRRSDSSQLRFVDNG